MKKKILIIDDEKDLVFLMKTLLTSPLSGGDYEVFTAHNGVEGMKQAFTCKPDLIISDIVMPGKDGTELAEELKANPATKRIPIIFVTSLKKKDEEGPAKEGASNNFILAKPFDSKALLDKVKKYLEV